MEANETFVFTITAVTLVVGDLNNTANVTCEENKTVKNSTITVISHPIILDIEKTVDNDTVYVNDTVVFTIKVTNKGEYNATRVVVRDVLPKEFTFVKTNDTRFRNNVLNIAKLGIGESYAFTITAIANVNGTYTNVANATCKENKTVVEDNATVTVKPVVDVIINKTADKERMFVEETVVFTVTVTNDGPSNATNVVITDVVPEQFRVTNFTNGYNNITNQVVVPFMAVNSTYSFTITAVALVNGTLNNTANVTCEENHTVKNSTVYVPVDPVVNLVINKTVDYDTVYVGESVVFTINVTNKGPSNATNVRVVDVLPAGFTSDDVTEFSIPKLNVNESRVFTINAVAVINDTWINVASANCTENGTVVNDTATVVVLPLADLCINKLVSDDSVHNGEIVDWTVIVSNNGPSKAVNVVVVDVIPDGLVDVGVVSIGKGAFKNNVWSIGDLAYGETVALVLKTTVNATNTTIVNVVNVTSDIYDPNETNNNASNSTDVPPEADLMLIKVADKDSVKVGEIVEFTIVVINLGPDTAINTRAYDILPKGLKFINYTATIGTYDNNTGKWDIGDLGCGEGAILNIVAKALVAGKHVNEAYVESDTYDPDTSNNYDNATVDVVEDVPEIPTLHPTGNPFVMVLLALFAIVGINVRRKI